MIKAFYNVKKSFLPIFGKDEAIWFRIFFTQAIILVKSSFLSIFVLISVLHNIFQSFKSSDFSLGQNEVIK